MTLTREEFAERLENYGRAMRYCDEALIAALQKDLCDSYADLLARVEGLERERDEAYILTARMHEAAVGSVRGPIVGVVEDMANLRSRLADLERQVAAAQAGATRLRECLVDFAENGLRADLSPTHDLDNPEEFWHSYIRRVEESVKLRAKQALAGNGTDCPTYEARP